MDEKVINYLRDKFRFAILNVSEIEEEVFGLILKSHSDISRYYHNLKHLYEMLLFLEPHQSEIEDFQAVILAVLFHDIVYDSKANNNEENSAEVAGENLRTINLDPALIDRVTKLILATKNHRPIIDFKDSYIFLDADLAILSSQKDRYLEYVAEIRREYSWASNHDYASRRILIMKSFLDRPFIYNLHNLYPHLEEAARTNIQAEIETLSIVLN